MPRIGTRDAGCQLMQMASPQLPLEIGLADTATLENLWPREALKPLLATVRAIEPASLHVLHGRGGVGKTHLLQALCHRHHGAVYLPLASLVEYPPADLLEALEHAPLLALDDMHCVAGRAQWEEALFHLINRARASGSSLWFSATLPPGKLALDLEDLRSRLAGGIIWALPDCSDAEKEAILCFRAQRRGLALSAAQARYLCAHDSRALGDLLATLERLDRASLQLKRPLSVPLIKEIMGW